MKKISLLSLTLVLAVLIMPISLQASALSDISSHKNRTAIEYLNDNGIVQGYEDGTYKPDAGINRAEFSKIIIEATFDDATIESCLDEQMLPHWTYTFFPDVNRYSWYAKYVCVAKMNNIVSGYDDGLFRPDNPINKAEAIKIIVTSQGYSVPASVTGNTYSDVMSDDWFAPYVKAAFDANLIEDTGSAALSPGLAMTRAGMSEMTYRTLVSEGGTYEMKTVSETTMGEEEIGSDGTKEPKEILLEILNTENSEDIEDQILSILDTPEANYVQNQLLTSQLVYKVMNEEINAEVGESVSNLTSPESVRGLMHLYEIEGIVDTSVSIAGKDKTIIGVKTMAESSEGEEVYSFGCFPLVLDGEIWKIKMPTFFSGDIGFTTPGVRSTCLKEIGTQNLWSESDLVPVSYSSISSEPARVYLNGDLIDNPFVTLKYRQTYLPLKSGTNTLNITSVYDDPYEMDWTGLPMTKEEFESSFELEPGQTKVQIDSNGETLAELSMLKSEGSKTVEFDYQP